MPARIRSSTLAPPVIGTVHLRLRSGMAARRGRISAAAQLLGLAAVILAWQLVAVAAGIHILPGPTQTAPVLVDLVQTGRFIEPLTSSLQRTSLGFLLAFIGGIAYGVAAGRSSEFGRVTSLVFQIVLFSNTLVVVLWGLAILGHANNWAVIVLTGFVVFPTIAIFVRDVVKTVDADLLEMGSSYHATTSMRLRDIYIPFLVPTILAAARIGFSQSWKTVMLAEAFGFPGGIGWMIRQAYSGYNLRAVIAWLIIFIVGLLVVERLIRILEHRLVRWR